MGFNMKISYEEYLQPVLGKPKIGDTILLSETGIWTIDSIDSKNQIWCGGLKLDQTPDELQRIIPEEKIKELKEINKFKKGEFVEGLTKSNEIIKGEIDFIQWTDIEEPVWVKCDITRYTRPLKRESIKYSKPNYSFVGWLKKFKNKR